MTAKMEDRQVKFEVKNTKDKKYGSFSCLLQFPIQHFGTLKKEIPAGFCCNFKS